MLATSLIASALLAAPAFAATAEQWRNRTIYQLVVDRFATPDGSSPACDTSNRVYCGGTWNGVVSKLDYIQDMGFDAVWISPVVANIEGTTAYGEAFHGYWTQDINALNSHFGTASDLQALAAALHKRNMYLMVDIVVNHVASPKNPPDYTIFTPFDQASQFHTEVFIQQADYTTNQTAVEQGWLGDTNLPLPDIDTEDPNIVSTYNTWVGQLVSNYSVDGLRIDTVKHIRQDFWPDFAKSAGVYTVGEVEDNRTDYLAGYTKVIDSVLDYSTYYSVFPAFSSTSGNLSTVSQVVQEAQSSFNNGEFFVGSFIENHDQPRFQSITTDQALVMNAMSWPFIQDGIPILYYGQEQGYTGSNDPANREALWLSGYDTNKTLVKHVTKLNAARRAAAAADSTYLTTGAKFLIAAPNTLAVQKPGVLALLANGGNSSTPQWTVPNAGFKANEVLMDIVACTTVTADGNGGVTVTGSGGMPLILMPTAVGSPVCSSTASSTPASSQKNAASVLATQIFGVTLAAILAAAVTVM
ncbi:hypothetical protein EUX98_g2466 [Antrodiella citrinella]|uniref:alpha-amylase n=1 Tax=Antrodiella citrinella TaxID=2447956 RepID=A0A4S4MYZ4_9APHY|nr:hypothetical protein EUX98_g2466 [Antrodiella citrinella]